MLGRSGLHWFQKKPKLKGKIYSIDWKRKFKKMFINSKERVVRKGNINVHLQVMCQGDIKRFLIIIFN